MRLLCCVLAMSMFTLGISSCSANRKDGLTLHDSRDINILRGKAEDRGGKMADRLGAVEKLVEIGGSDATAALVSLLPGEWDRLTLEVIQSLEKIGNPSALPKLEEMSREKDFEIPDKINTALESAIRSLKSGGK